MKENLLLWIIEIRKFESCSGSIRDRISLRERKWAPILHSQLQRQDIPRKTTARRRSINITLVILWCHWHHQTAERPSLWHTGMRNRPCLSRADSQPSRNGIYHTVMTPDCCCGCCCWASRATHMYDIHGAERAHFMAEERPICVAQQGATPANGSRMDDSVRGCNGHIVRQWRRNWLCLLE